jgi:hypothetical protein
MLFISALCVVKKLKEELSMERGKLAADVQKAQGNFTVRLKGKAEPDFIQFGMG